MPDLMPILQSAWTGLGEFVTWLQKLPWKDIFDSGEKATKSLALILAGVAAYYTFLRGRVFRPKLELRMSSSSMMVAQQEFLKITATLKNTGASRIDFDLPH